MILRILTVLMVPVLFGLFSSHAVAQKGGQKETFVVVQVGDDYQVVAGAELTAFKKKIADDYKAELDAYKKAKQDAAKNKQKFTQKTPKKVSVKTKGTFKTQTEADEAITKLREKETAKKKTGGGGGKKTIRG